MIFRESLLKKYSYSQIYSRLVQDLQKLEIGFDIFIPQKKTVKAGLLLYSADNLEAHQLGGFSCSFSSRSICRFCHIQYNDLDQHIHDYDGDESHKRWQISEYDSIAGSFEPLPSRFSSSHPKTGLYYRMKKSKKSLSSYNRVIL